MPSPLRRGKILDTSLSAFFLIIFGLVPVVYLLTRGSRRFEIEKVQTAYTALIILSWPFFCLGFLLLFYFWRKDRSVDKTHFSTATSGQLSVMALALFSTVVGCVLLFAAILLATINRFQQNGSKLYIVIDIISMVLVCWITYLILSFLSEVRRLRQSLQEFAQNQPESQQSQTRREYEASHEPQQAFAEPAEPTFV